MKTLQEDTTATKAVESPKYEFDAEAFKKALMAQVEAAGGATAFYAKAGGAAEVAKSMMKPFYEALLQTEMEAHLGYKKHAPGEKPTENSRNGKGSKTIRGDFGEIAIETPRDRDASFEPQIIKKRETSVGNFTDKIISLYMHVA